jgi:hypothetical protein
MNVVLSKGTYESTYLPLVGIFCLVTWLFTLYDRTQYLLSCLIFLALILLYLPSTY